MNSKLEGVYEKNQRFNRLVTWLHSLRYRNILALFAKVSQESRGKAITVVDIGCAHAKLFSVLDQRFHINYTGIEINSSRADIAQSRYSQYPNFSLIRDNATNALPLLGNADVIVALETLEHIVGRDVVRIVEAIAAAKPRYFVASVPVEIGPSIWLKNIGSFVTGYNRHKEYLWRETFWAGLYQLDKLPPHGTSHKSWDWRWLAQTIRLNMKIIELRRLPFSMLPAAVAFSIFFVAVPRQE